MEISPQKPKIGVLLVNLGSPNSPSTRDVRVYLRQFLMDGRIIDIPYWQRWALVNLIIAPFRAPKSAKLYQRLWMEEGAPLKIYGFRNRNELQKKLGKQFVVEIAMRYQNPSIESALKELQSQNVRKIIVLPLFAQYSSATVGSIHEQVLSIVQKWQTIPSMSLINNYYNHPLFVETLFENSQKWTSSKEYEHYIFTYHGIPQTHTKAGHMNSTDCTQQGCTYQITPNNFHCYKAQCYATTALLIKRLGIPSEKCTTCFQSRLGKAVWTQPYTSDVVTQLGKRGVKRVLVFTPAFVADCLETTIEISHEYQEEFVELGGECLDLVASCNDSETWVRLLEDVFRDNVSKY